MTFQQFEAQLVRLLTHWKQCRWSDKGAQIALFAELREFTVEIVERAITELLLNHKGPAPTADEIKAQVREQVAKKGAQRSSCRDCDGTGLSVTALGQFVLCICPAAKSLIEKKLVPLGTLMPQSNRPKLISGGRERATGEKDE